MPKKLTIEELRKMALEKGGECLSEAYANLRAKYRWRCAAGHEWVAIANSIRTGHWCPKCAAGQRLKGIEQLYRLAEERGGHCLSDVYIGTQAKYRWCCAAGHEWVAIANSIRTGRWCPKCAAEEKKRQHRRYCSHC